MMKIPSNHSNGTVEMLARWGGGGRKATEGNIGPA